MRVIGAIVIGSIHLLAAVVFLGGAFFADQILRPVAGSELEPPQARALGISVGRRFTVVAWVCAGILLLTGLARSAAIGALSPSVLFATAYGTILLVKIALFAVLVAVGAVLLRQSAAMAKMADGGGSPAAMAEAAGRLRSLQVANMAIATVIVILAVVLRVIGVPE